MVINIYRVKHKVYTRRVAGGWISSDYRKLIKSAVLATLRHEQVDKPCVVTVLISDDEGIRLFNREYRDKDSSTDVLSFPMQEFCQSGWCGVITPEVDLVTGLIPLGDVIISTETILRQADEFGHSFFRETAHMVIHSTLHLLGYDHDNDEAEAKMRNIEEKLLLGDLNIKTRI
jgi:probable rRNA maturation factor